VTVPKFPTKDPNHRILAQQKSRFTHNYFYIRDEVLGPMIMRVPDTSVAGRRLRLSVDTAHSVTAGMRNSLHHSSISSSFLAPRA
jgi:hypothetical protein